MQGAYIQYIHSWFRYIILLLAIVVVVQSLIGMMGKKRFSTGNRKAALFLMIACDIQLLLGLALYFTGGWAGKLASPGVMKDTYIRFYAVEHAVGMIIAIILVHVGYSIAKKNFNDDVKFRRIFWSVFIALAVFFATIPWQSRPVVGKPNIPTLPA